MPKPLHQQVVVITGATSGIGRTTALQMGERGATLVLAARNEAALEDTAQAVQQRGGTPYPCVTDVSDYAQVERLTQTAIAQFGRIDTWINNAAGSIYATVEDTTVSEYEQVIAATLMSQIYGVKAVLPHLKGQGGGTIINVSSALGARAVPYQSAYCAAKFGVKGFTDALRLEQQYEGTGVHVTLILPSSINTPLFSQVPSKLGVRPRPIPPVYQPDAVAEAIVFAAENPRREIVVGAGGELLILLERISPALVDWGMQTGGIMFRLQESNKPDDGRSNLATPSEGLGATTGDYSHEALPSSWYTRYIEQHPIRKRALITVLAGALALFGSRTNRR